MTADLFNLIPDEYVVASSSNFIKLPADGNSIKVYLVGPAAIGYSYWTNDKKCVRSKTKFSSTPDIKVREDGTADTVKEYMVFRCYQYDDTGARTEGLLEVTQLSIKGDICRIFRDPDYKEEDGTFWQAFKISTSGKGLKTKYKVDAILLRETNRPTITEMLDFMGRYDLDKVLYSTAKPDVEEELSGANGSF